MPHERGFACIDKERRGLTRVAAGVAAGFVWVTPSAVPEGASTELVPRAWLGAQIAEDLEGFGIATSVAHELDRRVVEHDMSWKLAIDIFLETYHLRPTHKDTIYPMFFDNLGLVDRQGPHLRNIFPKRSIRELVGTDESTWSLRHHANILFHVFPSTLVLIQPDHAAVLNVWPIGTNRTQVASYLLIPERATTDKARGYWKANADVLYGATDEDFAMGESIQRGLSCGANKDVVFAAYEHALTHFHQAIADPYAGDVRHSRCMRAPLEVRIMPEKKTMARAKKDKAEGKAPSTQAGEFVREEMDHIREGKHGARSTKQAIAIGLSKARRAGVKLPAPKTGAARTKKQAKRDSAQGATDPKHRPSKTRSRGATRALKREGSAAATPRALSKQGKRSAARRTRRGARAPPSAPPARRARPAAPPPPRKPPARAPTRRLTVPPRSSMTGA